MHLCDVASWSLVWCDISFIFFVCWFVPYLFARVYPFVGGVAHEWGDDGSRCGTRQMRGPPCDHHHHHHQVRRMAQLSMFAVQHYWPAAAAGFVGRLGGAGKCAFGKVDSGRTSWHLSNAVAKYDERSKMCTKVSLMEFGIVDSRCVHWSMFAFNAGVLDLRMCERTGQIIVIKLLIRILRHWIIYTKGH